MRECKVFMERVGYNYFEKGDTVEVVTGVSSLEKGSRYVVKETKRPIFAADPDSCVFVEGWDLGFSGCLFKQTFGSKTIKGRYVGPIEELFGLTALVYVDKQGRLLAQFDDIPTIFDGTDLSHTWTQYPQSSWEVFDHGIEEVPA